MCRSYLKIHGFITPEESERIFSRILKNQRNEEK
nr:MAG TPA: hypothetical protein [Caudoviricetes sp.]